MNFYKYKGQGCLLISFTANLGPRTCKFSNFYVFSKTAGLIEIKLHLNGVRKSVSSRDLGHMTKMAVMPI